MEINFNTLPNSSSGVGLNIAEKANAVPESQYPALGPVQQETQVTLSPQAQILQKTGADNQSAVDAQLEESGDNNANQSIRVSSSLGEAASAAGLTEQEAIKLYQSIKDLL
mgnify:CR=1 FL=1